MDLAGCFPRATQLLVLDYFLSLFVVAPLVVGYYKGFVYIMMHLVYPKDLLINLCISGITGYGIIFLAFLFQDLLEPLTRAPRQTAFYIVFRLYNLALAFANVGCFYSVWCLSHIYLADSVGGALKVLLVTTAIMMCSRCYLNVCLSPPFYLMPNEPDEFFKAPTRFGCKPSKSLLMFTLDVSFSVFVINTLVVLIWKNTWTLLDLTLYPDDFQSSTAASLIIGFSQTIVLYYFQTTAYAVAAKLHSLPRIIFINCWLWFTGFTCINVWRGVWYIGDLFVDEELYAAWLPVVCLLFLQTFFSDNVVATKGTLQEHQYFPEKAKAVYYPVNYFQTLCKEQVIEVEKKEVTYVYVENGVPETRL